MKVGITGASGFLGRAIIEEGRRRGWHVVAFSRHPKKGIEGADEIRSLADSGSMDLNDFEAIIHLAG